MITTKEFWLGALERLLKTFLQAFVAALGVAVGSDITGVGLTDLNWLGALNIAGVAAFLSLCTSIGNASFTAGNPVPASPPADLGSAYVSTPPRRVDLDPPA